MYTSDNDKLFLSKLDDAVYLSEKRRSAVFLSFMSERKQALAEEYLRGMHAEHYRFFGGYENAERRMLGVFYEEEEPFPLEAVVFTFRKSDKLTHRDFLGALMSLGIERETVGDILVEDGRCVVFVKSELKDYITSQIFKIGRTGVKTEELREGELPQGRGFDENIYTVSSLRLDNVVAALAGLSREKTKTLILSGQAALNYTECTNISKQLSEGDVLSIRGKGKFVLHGVIGETKKHRIKISVIHYR